MEKWINQAPETREQVDTNEANLLENTRERLAEILEQVWKIPEGLKSFAERFKFDKKTWWAVFLSAMIFATGTSVAHASENAQAILDNAVASWSSEEFVEGLFEQKEYEKLRKLAEHFERDPSIIRDCSNIDDMMEKWNCEDDKEIKESRLIGDVSEVRQAEQEETLAEQEETKESIRILKKAVAEQDFDSPEVVEAAEHINTLSDVPEEVQAIINNIL